MADTLKGKRIALVSVDWDEVSGVDHPANQSEGWLVVKSADGGSTELNKSSDDDVDDSEVIAEILSNYLDGAPSDISDAAQKVIDYIATVETGSGEDDTEADNNTDTENDASTTNKAEAKGKVRKFFDGLFKSGGSAVVITEAQQEEFIQSLHPGMTADERHQAVEAFKRSVLGDKD